MIRVTELSKSFGEIKAVDKISFEVKEGEVLGFLGPNGAGKSTTMKMITSFISPSGGDATVFGKSILSEPIEVRKKIGYMPENAPLYDDMTVDEFLHYTAQLRGLEKKGQVKAVEKVIEMCALKDVQFQTIETLSKGYKRRTSMAQALIHDPQVLILDEPTDGLDPNQKHDVRTLIKSLAKDKCVILSTHILEEVEAVCTRAIIISSGKKLFDGEASELKEKSSLGRIDDVFRAITTGQEVEGVSL
ncbi:MAG: ATP-binding cassette domain-containing protein [Bdellovibrionota bacterium]|nr:ATP-binding cassette domain-containing protein [Bdellovibrionota bacterium]